MKYIYFFGARKAQGSGEMKDLLGGKGAGLAEMTRIGLPVKAVTACVSSPTKRRVECLCLHHVRMPPMSPTKSSGFSLRLGAFA